MAILRSVDGKFFEVPDDDLEKFEVPPEKVKNVLDELDQEEGPQMAGPAPGGSQSPQVVVHVSGGPPQGGAPMGGPEGGEEGDEGVQPYHHRRRRSWWRNHWRNCWRNCY